MPKSTNVAEELNQKELNQKYIQHILSLSQWNILYKITDYTPEYFLSFSA